MNTLMKRMALVWLVPAMAVALMACPRNGPRPEVVDQVEIARYVGLWHEIASNPVFFNRDLVAVTAEYAIIDDRTVSVLNKGRRGAPDGPLEQIEGRARVVDKATNAKLAVSFDSVFFSRIFKGQYWIVLLDEEAYQYAVVTDSRQSTLFVLYREPEMPLSLYEAIIQALQAKQINTSLLRVTGGLSS